MTTTVTLDTETTHLDHAIGDMWEAAFIVEDHPDPAMDGEWAFMLPGTPITHADPAALAIGRFMERITAVRMADSNQFMMRGNVAVTACPESYRQMMLAHDRPRVGDPDPEWHTPWWSDHTLAVWIARAVENATIVGVRPEFDLPFLAKYVTAHHGPMSPYYHTIDVCQVTLGMIPGPVPRRYSSHGLVDLVGLDVTEPSTDERHTALGDARWARRWLAALDGANTSWTPTEALDLPAVTIGTPDDVEFEVAHGFATADVHVALYRPDGSPVDPNYDVLTVDRVRVFAPPGTLVMIQGDGSAVGRWTVPDA